MKEKVILVAIKGTVGAVVGETIRVAYKGASNLHSKLKEAKKQRDIENTKKLIKETFEELDIIEKSLSLQEEGA